jgi:hypothetical protein
VDSEAVWLVIETDDGYRLLPMADLARYLARDGVAKAPPPKEAKTDPGDGPIDLTAIPAQQLDISLLDSLASLHDASRLMRETGAEAVLVIESISHAEERVSGVLTRATVSAYYGM